MIFLPSPKRHCFRSKQCLKILFGDCDESMSLVLRFAISIDGDEIIFWFLKKHKLLKLEPKAPDCFNAALKS